MIACKVHRGLHNESFGCKDPYIPGPEAEEKLERIRELITKQREGWDTDPATGAYDPWDDYTTGQDSIMTRIEAILKEE